MHGSIIGMVPKHFIIALIENHCWYEYTTTSKGYRIEDAYSSVMERSKNYESLIEEGIETEVIEETLFA